MWLQTAIAVSPVDESRCHLAAALFGVSTPVAKLLFGVDCGAGCDRRSNFEEEPTQTRGSCAPEIKRPPQASTYREAGGERSQNAVGSRLVGQLAFVAESLEPHLKSLNGMA